MRKALVRSGIVVVLLGALITPRGDAQAAGGVTVHVSRYGGWTTNPARDLGHALLRNMGASITIPPGHTRYLSSKLVMVNAGEVTAVTPRIDCRQGAWSSDLSTVVATAISGQNVLPTSSPTTILTRAHFTAPSSSALVCSLDAIFINHTSMDHTGRIYTTRDSYLQDVHGDLGWKGQQWQPSQVLVEQYSQAARLTIDVPAAASTVHAIGDVNVTTCYGSGLKGLCGQATRTHFRQAYVGTQLLAQRLNADGSRCGALWSNGPLVGHSVSNYVHHLKINAFGDVPVSGNCTSRRVELWVRVTVSSNGNSLLVEANNQSVSAVVAP